MEREKKKALSQEDKTKDKNHFEESLHPDVKKLYGSLALNREMSWKDELTEILREKHHRSTSPEMGDTANNQ